MMPLLLALAYALLMWRFSSWQTERMLSRQARPLQDREIAAVTQRLAQALEVPQIKVQILDIAPINGLAMPDGRIFLTQGFLHKKGEGAVSAEELASVIAHEMGHIAHGHSRRRMIDFTGQNAAVMLLAGLLNRFLPFIGGWIAGLMSRLLMARLSRRDEFEADAYASALMIKAGFGTAPQKSLFRKLDQLTGATGHETAAWLRSHPKTAERIAAIEANEARWLQGAKG